jgi:hypothetical protein
MIREMFVAARREGWESEFEVKLWGMVARVVKVLRWRRMCIWLCSLSDMRA